jgi:putative ABC transport system permease protein
MNMQFKKALKDLTTNPTRTLLVVSAMVLGLWGLGTIWVSNSILTNDLRTNFSATKPAHVIFESDDFEKLNIADFCKGHEIESAEFRDFSLHRIEVSPNEWIPLWLYGVQDFRRLRLAKIFYQEGLSVPAIGSMLIERDGKKISTIVIGSAPRVRIGNKIKQVPVSSICYDPAQAPATQDHFIYAYTDQVSYTQITGLKANRRLIVRLKNVQSANDVILLAKKLEADFKNLGINILSTQIPKFNQHPHQWQLDTLLLLIGSIGLLAMLLGAVLVSQLVRAIMSSQTRQIGVLKAIGSTQYQTLRIYMTMLLILGAIGGAMAIPLAVMSGKAFAYFVAGKLNFDILTTSPPLYIYISLALSSLLLPFTLSLPILLKGTSISVKEALNNYGIPANVKVRPMRFLKSLNLPDMVILAIRNSQRNIQRLTITIVSMALGVAVFSTGFNVRQSLWNLLYDYKNEIQYDVQVVLNKPVSETEAKKALENIPQIQKMGFWLGGNGEIQSKIASTDLSAGIVSLPYQTDLLKLKIVQGSWLSASSQMEVVLNQQAWDLYAQPKLDAMIRLTINSKTISAKYVGLVEQFDKPKIYIEKQQYNKFFNQRGLVNTMVIKGKTHDDKAVLGLKQEVEKALVNTDLNVSYVLSQSEKVRIIYDHLNIILSTIVFLSFLILLVSAIGMASATGINIVERTREIGVMRAIGTTPVQIYRLFVIEGLIVFLLSIVLGIFLSFPLSQIASVFFGHLLLGKETTLTFAFSLPGFVITLLVTLIFSWMASKLPAKAVIKITTQKALSYE